MPSKSSLRAYIAWIEHALNAGKFEAVFGKGKFVKMHGGITSFYPRCHAEGLLNTATGTFLVKLVAATGEDVIQAFSVPVASGKKFPDSDVVLSPLKSAAEAQLSEPVKSKPLR